MNILGRLLWSAHEDDSPALHEAIAWAVDRIDPRLKNVGGYPDRYRDSVAHALEYVQALAAQVPGPVHVTPEAHDADPVVHAMFPLRDDLNAAVKQSRDMQAFFHERPDATEFYALICMRRQVKAQFGMEIEGEVLHRDVRQKVVYFTDYTVAEPGSTEAESRKRVAHGFFESLIAHVANRIEERRLEKLALDRERDELRAEMHSAPADRRKKLEHKLHAMLNRELRLVTSLELSRYHEDFDTVLQTPEKFLYLERTEMTLDSMGIVRKPDADGSDEIVFSDLIGRDRRRWTVTLVYCSHVNNDVTIANRLDEAQRWLGL